MITNSELFQKIERKLQLRINLQKKTKNANKVKLAIIIKIDDLVVENRIKQIFVEFFWPPSEDN